MRHSCALALFLVSCASCAHGSHVSDREDRTTEIVLRYLAQNMCEHADERAKLALEYEPDSAQLHNLLGMVRLRCNTQDPEPAIECFKRAIALDYDLAAAHNNFGAALLKRTRPEYALACEEFEEALKIDPGYADARENYGMCLTRRAQLATEDPEARRQLFADARSQMLRLLELEDRANAHMWLGFIDLVQGNAARAIASLQHCVELAPEQGECQLYLGQAHLALADCTPAIVAFSRAALDEATAPDARAGLAIAQDACAKQDAAIVARLEAIKKSPGDPEAHAELARIYREHGLHAEAELEWKNVIALDAKHCTAHFEVAMLADERLDTPGTIASCREFVLCARLALLEDARVEKCSDRLVALNR